jgi:hypothetical protein
MKIGEAHRTQSPSLYSANTIGAPMHPAPIGVADRRQGTSERQYIGAQRPLCAIILALRCPLRHYYNSAEESLKFKKRGGPNISVRLTYFHANHLLVGLYKQETEIR